MIAPRTRGRVYLQSFMDAVITFSTFWAFLFVFVLLQQGESRAQLEMLGAALFYSLTALAAVVLQGFHTIYSQPNWWRANWSMSHKLSLNQTLWAALALCVALVTIGDINTSRIFLLSWLALLYGCLLVANRYLPGKIIEAVADARAERTMLLGTVNENPNLKRWRDHHEKSGSEVFEYLPDYSVQELTNLERLMHERNVIEVVFVEVPKQPHYLWSVMEICDRIGARCTLMSGQEALFGHKVFVTTDAGVQFIDLKVEPLEAAHNKFLKRVSDLMLVTVFLIFTVPLFCCIAIAQQLVSRGAVFSREPRVHLDGNTFYILKFRTKHLDGSSFAFGEVLCRYSIDEWPQIFNVFKGEMSVVGPRAHWPEENQAFQRAMQNQYIRSEVKPGITGLAQVRGLRGKPASADDIARRLEADLEYIGNWSLSLDFVILLKTAWPWRRG